MDITLEQKMQIMKILREYEVSLGAIIGVIDFMERGYDFGESMRMVLMEGKTNKIASNEKDSEN
jgi:repressor of nif and glnA expression